MWWMWRGLSKFKTFPGFLGSEKVAQSLFSAATSGKVAHTLLFVGPAGIGKKTLATQLAQKLMCPAKCGKCKTCVMFEKGVHPDFRIIAPEGDSVKLEHAKDLKSFLAGPPNIAPYKVAVLENAQNLTVEAGNSLLKVLEEPPASSICVLTADRSDNVLSTLVSRSQVHTFSALPRAIVRGELIRNGVPDERVDFLACFSEGILGRAMGFSQDDDFWQQRINMAETIKGILARKYDPLLGSEKWASIAERALELIEYWLRDMLMLQTVQGFNPVNTDLFSELEQCAQSCPAEKTITLLEQCALARKRLSARCNSRLVFDSLLLKMWEV